MKPKNIPRDNFPDLKDLMDKLLQEENIGSILPSITVEDIPGIDLYMDQVTTFMEMHLGSARRSDTDKVLTKTMINNYAKNDLLPPPQKKKYSKEHLIMMLFIYYFKGFLSMQDIRFLLQPLAQDFYGKADGPDICGIYKTIREAGEDIVSFVDRDIKAFTQRALESFDDADQASRSHLQYFSLISYLSMDICIKKRIVEKMIDEVSEKG